MATPTASGPLATGRTREARWPVVSATRWGSQPRTGAAPLHRPGADASGFADLFSLGDVDRILSSTTPRWPAFRLVKGPSSTVGPTPGRGGWRPAGGRPGRPAAGVRAVHGGATIVLQSLHRFWPPLARFGRDLELALTHPRPGERLRHPARRPGAGAAPRHPRRVRAPGVRAQALGGAPPRRPARRAAARGRAGLGRLPLHPPAVPARGPDGRDRLGPPDRRGGRHHLGDVARRAVTPAVEGALSGEPLPAGYAADPATLTAGLAEQLAESGGGWTSSTRPRLPRPPPTGSGPASRRCCRAAPGAAGPGGDRRRHGGPAPARGRVPAAAARGPARGPARRPDAADAGPAGPGHAGDPGRRAAGRGRPAWIPGPAQPAGAGPRLVREGLLESVARNSLFDAEAGISPWNVPSWTVPRGAVMTGAEMLIGWAVAAGRRPGAERGRHLAL